MKRERESEDDELKPLKPRETNVISTKLQLANKPKLQHMSPSGRGKRMIGAQNKQDLVEDRIWIAENRRQQLNRNDKYLIEHSDSPLANKNLPKSRPAIPAKLNQTSQNKSALVKPRATSKAKPLNYVVGSDYYTGQPVITVPNAIKLNIPSNVSSPTKNSAGDTKRKRMRF